jgi:hypothetical protein
MAGIADNDKPGSIQVIRFPFERIFEIQAHSLPIEKLRLSFDNQFLYSAGQDGMFGIFHVIDKDQVKKDKEYTQLQVSEEILIEKSEQDKKKAEIEHLQNQIEIEKQKKETTQQNEIEKKQKKIADITREIEDQMQENEIRYKKLQENKNDMELVYRERINAMTQAHLKDMEDRKKDYGDKMEADETRFKELLAQKEEDTHNFEERLHELGLYHEKVTNEL